MEQCMVIAMMIQKSIYPWYGRPGLLFIESQSATLIPIEICFPHRSRGRNNKPLTLVFLEYVLFRVLLRVQGRRDAGRLFRRMGKPRLYYSREMSTAPGYLNLLKSACHARIKPNPNPRTALHLKHEKKRN